MGRPRTSDSPDAVRMRRVRAHNRGDHELCTFASCSVRRAEAAPDEPLPDNAGIGLAVAEFVDALGFPDKDPRKLLGRIAVKLATVLDEKPSAAIASELRWHIISMSETPNDPAGFVDELRLRRAVRRLDMLIADATPSPWAAERGAP